MFGSGPKMASSPSQPTQVDYNAISMAYQNQLSSAGKASGASSTNPTGGQGALTAPQIATKALVGQ